MIHLSNLMCASCTFASSRQHCFLREFFWDALSNKVCVTRRLTVRRCSLSAARALLLQLCAALRPGGRLLPLPGGGAQRQRLLLFASCTLFRFLLLASCTLFRFDALAFSQLCALSLQLRRAAASISALCFASASRRACSAASA
jgi:hypothetical protein